MDISKTSTRHLKQQNILFIILFLTMIGLLAFLSNRYVYLADWTVNNQNSLNEVSLQLLSMLDSPVEIVSYTNNNSLKHAIRELIERYQRVKPDISLRFVNPNADPEKTRLLNISVNGELVINYQGRHENLSRLSEQDLSNSLHRLLRAQQRKIFFIEGHGERSPKRQANFDLSSFAKHLKKQGFLVDSLNLAKEMSIPDNTSVLVIASPRATFLPGEVSLIIDYLKTGGNLLWLNEPLDLNKSKPMLGLLPLAEVLGIEFLDGVVVDPTTQQYGISRPDYAIITDYPAHPICNNFSTVTLFPQAAGIERLPGFDKDPYDQKTQAGDENNENQSSNMNLKMTTILNTIERSWVETSPLKDTVHFSDLLDIAGPVSIGMALEQQLNQQQISNDSDGTQKNPDSTFTKEQRIVIIGDGDFLSNTFLGNAGNLSLGINIFNWLSHDEQFIRISTRVKNDIILDISPAKLSLLGSFFLLILPGLLLLTGSLIWFKRRNR